MKIKKGVKKIRNSDFLSEIKIFPNSNRSQAAMEFLMTYGWAILAAIVAIGALAYFGAFNPTNMITGNAIVGAPFGIADYQVKAGTGVILDLNYGMGEDAQIVLVNVSNCGFNDSIIPIDSGGKAEVTIPCSEPLTVGQKFKNNFEITYNQVGMTRNLSTSGSITSKVTE